MRPLPATQRITARIIVRRSRGTMSRMSLVRTWRPACGTRQIIGRRRRLLLLLLLGLLLAGWWLTVSFGVLGSWQRLAISAIHGWGLADTTPDCVGRHESLSLGRDGSEDAVLVEAHAIGAASVVGGFKTRASDLPKSELGTEDSAKRDLPCVSCNNDRRWQFAGEARVVGDVDSCRREVVVGRGMDRGAGVLGSIREGLANGGAAVAVAGGGDAGPCRGEGPVVVVRKEEGGMWRAGDGGPGQYKRRARVVGQSG